jgi:hypothetical protein
LSDLRKQLQDAEARLVAQGVRHAEAEARWKEDHVGLAEVQAGQKADVEWRLMNRMDPPSAAASSTSAAALPAYGGEYLALIIKLLEQGRESSAADACRAEVLSKQAEVLRRLNAAMAARLSADLTLSECVEKGAEEEGGEGQRGVGFDSSVDDDEVLLRLFRELDRDGNGTISMEELLAAPLLCKAENAEMSRMLRRAMGCDLQALEEALQSVGERELELFAQRVAGSLGDSEGAGHATGRSAAVKAIFDAISSSGRAAVLPGAGQAAAGCTGEGDTRVATRADLDCFLQAKGANAKGSTLATALERLLAALPVPADGQDSQELDFLAVKAAARKVPRVAAQRLEWVRTMGLDAALARHLPPGTLDDGCAQRVGLCVSTFRVALPILLFGCQTWQ